MSFLDVLADDDIIVMGAYDEMSYKLNDNLRNKLRALGSTKIDEVQWRTSWAFIGSKMHGKLYESIGVPNDKCAYAFVSK